MNDIPGSIRSLPIRVPCPHCGQALQETVGRLNDDPAIQCPRCQHVFQIQAEQLKAALEGAGPALQTLLDRVNRFGKRH